jgi:ATP-binding cassette subfamily B (MDR/TAP) protein 1
MALTLTGLSISSNSPNMGKLAKSKNAAGRIYSMVDRQPLICDSNESVTPTSLVGNIKLEKVEFRYPSRPDSVVLDKLSLEIQAGKVTALVGPSGSGKVRGS